MAHQTLYRRYRPQRFSEVKGQEHLVSALRNAVREQRVGHAYMFSGPRGTGKTTSARILAKAMNCADVVEGEPCGVCDSCVAIAEGTSFDVHELDAASNNGVDAIRELIGHAALGTPGRTKVYILDEVHMLSAAASNALLKTLEEPPPHVIFVLATTDPQKVLPTIRSRCQQFEVHLVGAEVLSQHVREVAEDASIALTDEMVDYSVRHGGGSVRDTLSVLEQLTAAGGVPDDDEAALDEIVAALATSDTRRALLAVEHALAAGRSPRVLGESLIARLRDVFLAAMGVELGRLADLERAKVVDQAEELGAARATRAIETIGSAFVGISDAPDQRIPLEVALVRLTRPEADTSVEALAERLERLERALSGRAPLPAAATDQPAPPPAADQRDSAPDSGAAPEVDRAPSPVEQPAAAAVETIHSTAEPLAAERSGGGARPADAARAELARARAGGSEGGRRSRGPRAAPVSRTESRPAPAPAEAPVPPAGPPAPAPAAAPGGASAPPPEPATREAPSGTASGRGAPASGPSIEVVDDHWPTLLDESRGKVRSLFRAGRVLRAGGGTVVVGLPNQPHLDRCLDVVDELADGLAERLGAPVTVELVVDDGSDPARGAGGPPDPPPAEQPDRGGGPAAGRGDGRGGSGGGAPPSPAPSAAGGRGEGSPEARVRDMAGSVAQRPAAGDDRGATDAAVRAAPAEARGDAPERPVRDVGPAGAPSAAGPFDEPVGEEAVGEEDLEGFDPSELEDATDAATSQTDLVLQLFPGAEEVPTDEPAP